MKRITIGLAVIGLTLLAVQVANASLTVSLVNPATGEGTSFGLSESHHTFYATVRLLLTEDTQISSLLVNLQDVTVTRPDGGAGYFSIDSVAFDSIWATEDRADPTGDDLTSGNSYTSSDLGAYAQSYMDDLTPLSAGTYDLATLTLTLNGEAPGFWDTWDYVNNPFLLNLNIVEVGDAEGLPLSGGTVGADFQVVPAPGAAVLGMIGLTMVAWGRLQVQRKRQA